MRKACSQSWMMLLAGCWLVTVQSSIVAPIQWGDIVLSPDEEFKNQEQIQTMLFHRFYFSGELETEWGKIEGDLLALAKIGLTELPAIALGVANGLYHFFFFKESVGTPQMRTETMMEALALFNASLVYAKCFQHNLDIRDFLLGMCVTKFAFAQFLAAEIGASLAARHALENAAAVLSLASSQFSLMRSLPYFAAGLNWTQPQQIAFNDELYPKVHGPVWPNDEVPLISFFEDHFQEFRSELDATLSHGDLFDQLRELERNAEGLAVWPPGSRKHIELADLREEEPWKSKLCIFFNKTCTLLKQRPEIAECPRAAVMIARLGPGAWLKPHFGNSRRLVVHLGLITPLEPITMRVGPAHGITWEEGKAVVFDDTHLHDARHAGIEGARYILHMMICHPCEQRHLYPHLPSSVCDFADPLRTEVSRALRVEMDAKEAASRNAVRMMIPRGAPQDV